MKKALWWFVLPITTLPLYAKETRIVNMPCNQAINDVISLAAFHKWSSVRPAPDAMALNISTHANYAKQLIPTPIGGLWSHEKFGEVWFEAQGKNCVVNSNGHPADVVVTDIGHARGIAQSGDMWERMQQAKKEETGTQ